MEQSWLAEWIYELTQETAAYVYIYEVKIRSPYALLCDRENWMDKWMQYRILQKIGKEMVITGKTSALNPEFSVVEPEKLLYNEKENYNQFQALYESTEEPWKVLVMRIMGLQQAIIRRLGNGGLI